MIFKKIYLHIPIRSHLLNFLKLVFTILSSHYLFFNASIYLIILIFLDFIFSLI